MRFGDLKRIKKAVYLKADGYKPQIISQITGLSPRQLRSAQIEASEDIFKEICK